MLKRSRVRYFLKMYAIDILLLQETKVAFPIDSFLRSIWGSSLMGWSCLNSMGATGEQCIGWRDNVFDYSSELVGEFLITV